MGYPVRPLDMLALWRIFPDIRGYLLATGGSLLEIINLPLLFFVFDILRWIALRLLLFPGIRWWVSL